jgi:hypothetical protein
MCKIKGTIQKTTTRDKRVYKWKAENEDLL